MDVSQSEPFFYLSDSDTDGLLVDLPEEILSQMTSIGIANDLRMAVEKSITDEFIEMQDESLFPSFSSWVNSSMGDIQAINKYNRAIIEKSKENIQEEMIKHGVVSFDAYAIVQMSVNLFLQTLSIRGSMSKSENVKGYVICEKRAFESISEVYIPLLYKTNVLKNFAFNAINEGGPPIFSLNIIEFIVDEEIKKIPEKNARGGKFFNRFIDLRGGKGKIPSGTVVRNIASKMNRMTDPNVINGVRLLSYSIISMMRDQYKDNFLLSKRKKHTIMDPSRYSRKVDLLIESSFPLYFIACCNLLFRLGRKSSVTVSYIDMTNLSSQNEAINKRVVYKENNEDRNIGNTINVNFKIALKILPENDDTSSMRQVVLYNSFLDVALSLGNWPNSDASIGEIESENNRVSIIYSMLRQMILLGSSSITQANWYVNEMNKRIFDKFNFEDMSDFTLEEIDSFGVSDTEPILIEGADAPDRIEPLYIPPSPIIGMVTEIAERRRFDNQSRHSFNLEDETSVIIDESGSDEHDEFISIVNDFLNEESIRAQNVEDEIIIQNDDTTPLSPPLSPNKDQNIPDISPPTIPSVPLSPPDTPTPSTTPPITPPITPSLTPPPTPSLTPPTVSDIDEDPTEEEMKRIKELEEQLKNLEKRLHVEKIRNNGLRKDAFSYNASLTLVEELPKLYGFKDDDVTSFSAWKMINEIAPEVANYMILKDKSVIEASEASNILKFTGRLLTTTEIKTLKTLSKKKLRKYKISKHFEDMISSLEADKRRKQRELSLETSSSKIIKSPMSTKMSSSSSSYLKKEIMPIPVREMTNKSCVTKKTPLRRKQKQKQRKHIVHASSNGESVLNHIFSSEYTKASHFNANCALKLNDGRDTENSNYIIDSGTDVLLGKKPSTVFECEDRYYYGGDDSDDERHYKNKIDAYTNPKISDSMDSICPKGKGKEKEEYEVQQIGPFDEYDIHSYKESQFLLKDDIYDSSMEYIEPEKEKEIYQSGQEWYQSDESYDPWEIDHFKRDSSFSAKFYSNEGQYQQDLPVRHYSSCVNEKYTDGISSSASLHEEHIINALTMMVAGVLSITTAKIKSQSEDFLRSYENRNNRNKKITKTEKSSLHHSSYSSFDPSRLSKPKTFKMLCEKVHTSASTTGALSKVHKEIHQHWNKLVDKKDYKKIPASVVMLSLGIQNGDTNEAKKHMRKLCQLGRLTETTTCTMMDMVEDMHMAVSKFRCDTKNTKVLLPCVYKANNIVGLQKKQHQQ